MPTWIKSACVVLASSVLVILTAAGISRSARLAPATTRTASTTQISYTTTTTAATTPGRITASTGATPGRTTATPAAPAARYAVQPGNTLAGIAAATGVPGGWPALYAANRARIGPDPGLLYPGTVLALPGRPARYTVAPGDTLTGIAAALGVPGGWPALYAANHAAIGPDPGLIRAGTVLALPGRLVPARYIVTAGDTLTGIAAALLIAAAFATEPALAIARRRRAAAASAAARTEVPATGPAPAAAGPPPGPAGHARIIMADFGRVIVTRQTRDGTTCVLRPPGTDPRAILRVARLVLPEEPYEELAGQLGVPSGWAATQLPDAS